MIVGPAVAILAGAVAAAICCDAQAATARRHGRRWWAAKAGVFLAGLGVVLAASAVLAGVVVIAPRPIRPWRREA